MRTGIVAFIIGNVCFLYYLPVDWSELSMMEPYVRYQLIFILFVPFLFRLLYKSKTVFVSSQLIIYKNLYKQAVHIFIMFIFGYSFTAIYTNQFYPVLDLAHLEGKNITVKGYVDSIPRNSEKSQKFLFVITARNIQDGKKNKRWDDSFNGKVKLSWYRTHEVIKNGQQWQLTIRLKKPNGLLNGVFDYEKWLYQNRILATGYVRSGKQLDGTNYPLLHNYLSGLRQKLASQLDDSLADYPYKGLIKALRL
ncbi:MAG: DUF4131 domain-containing protein [gamma proteobacterium symbiont of Bathyaustriella thionipta]|nr:DUF4131 domain-containing protein [gamma proteobacterium symbiont of Bathyaustriella thionipta]MCU7954747.1 DUF4131 domain-containing protein [gamma proteobacterium symbiont of Bathyaustriella thionipta]MCU7958009.1 DUF4131 domain-containing protein [gamma proteobacterium symbiont of Bathyaustriella thionipta]MCU7968756.1 DUF4131 domain-containing protein [gamma proteobacterium symbiont of Bathyaustriella thionipta]